MKNVVVNNEKELTTALAHVDHGDAIIVNLKHEEGTTPVRIPDTRAHLVILNSRVTITGTTSAEAHDQATIIAYQNATITAFNNSRIYAHDNTSVIAHLGSVVEGNDDSTIHLEVAEVTIKGRATIEYFIAPIEKRFLQ